MKKFDLIAVSVILAAGLALAGVLLIGNRIPIEVTCLHPAACVEIGPYGSVEFEFSRPVDEASVESLWQTTPAVPGVWEWIDDRHARWHALQPFPEDRPVALAFLPGQAGSNGEAIQNEHRWEAQLRKPRVVVTRETDAGLELFSIALDGLGSPRQLTRVDGQVFNFQVSPDGERIALSVMNEQKGMDLWFVDRDGNGQEMVLGCGSDRCTTPAWSPDMKEIVFTRQNAGLEIGGPPGAPRPWLFDIRSGQTSPLFEDPQALGYGAAWSPDGKWLSIWDGSAGGIQIVNRKSGETFLLESSSGTLGSWTTDSRNLYFPNIIIGESSYRNVVLKADIPTRAISIALGGALTGDGYSVENPIVNPVTGQLAVTLQPNVRIPGRLLKVIDPETEEGEEIVMDLSSIPSFYSWTPDGEHLLYQLDYLSGTQYDVEIWQWERSTGRKTLISKGDRWPQWLP